MHTPPIQPEKEELEVSQAIAACKPNHFCLSKKACCQLIANWIVENGRPVLQWEC
jgi:hypothetical protein